MEFSDRMSQRFCRVTAVYILLRLYILYYYIVVSYHYYFPPPLFSILFFFSFIFFFVFITLARLLYTSRLIIPEDAPLPKKRLNRFAFGRRALNSNDNNQGWTSLLPIFNSLSSVNRE